MRVCLSHTSHDITYKFSYTYSQWCSIFRRPVSLLGRVLHNNNNDEQKWTYGSTCCWWETFHCWRHKSEQWQVHAFPFPIGFFLVHDEMECVKCALKVRQAAGGTSRCSNATDTDDIIDNNLSTTTATTTKQPVPYWRKGVRGSHKRRVFSVYKIIKNFFGFEMCMSVFSSCRKFWSKLSGPTLTLASQDLRIRPKDDRRRSFELT